MATGTLNNIATVLIDGTTYNTNTTSTTLYDLVVKIASVSAPVGGKVTFEINVVNLTLTDYTNVVITDVLDATKVTFDAGSGLLNGAPITEDSSSPVQYTIPTVTAGSTAVLTFTATVIAVA